MTTRHIRTDLSNFRITNENDEWVMMMTYVPEQLNDQDSSLSFVDESNTDGDIILLSQLSQLSSSNQLRLPNKPNES